MNRHALPEGWSAGLPQSPAPVSTPAAPCCERKAPAQSVKNTSAQIVAPVQIALMPAAAPDAILPAIAESHLSAVATPPALASPLSLLCTLLI
ncbi:MAG TPA: hypothetical protein VM578_08885 [Candidatus Saccharimonadales bacterium]|nr:hypothetical protein [Candidatus Saccharimonadales bacterium]